MPAASLPLRVDAHRQQFFAEHDVRLQLGRLCRSQPSVGQLHSQQRRQSGHGPQRRSNGIETSARPRRHAHRQVHATFWK